LKIMIWTMTGWKMLMINVSVCPISLFDLPGSPTV
jgi:hypothetical protein